MHPSWMDGKRVKRDKRSLLLRMGHSVYSKVRNRIAEDSDWKCSYCDVPVSVTPKHKDLLATIARKVPESRGGSWKRYNLVCSCRKCNEEKSNMTDDEYRLFKHMMKC